MLHRLPTRLSFNSLKFFGLYFAQTISWFNTYIHPFALWNLGCTSLYVRTECLHQTDEVEVRAAPPKIMLMPVRQDTNKFTFNAGFLKYFSSGSICDIFTCNYIHFVLIEQSYQAKHCFICSVNNLDFSLKLCSDRAKANLVLPSDVAFTQCE